MMSTEETDLNSNKRMKELLDFLPAKTFPFHPKLFLSPKHSQSCPYNDGGLLEFTFTMQRTGGFSLPTKGTVQIYSSVLNLQDIFTTRSICLV